MHHHVRHGHILGGPVDPQAIGVFPGFQDDGVISVVQVAVGDSYVAAGIDVEAAGERSRKRLQRDVANDGVLRIQQVHRPEGRSDHVNAFDQNVLALRQPDERRPQEGRDLEILRFRLRRLLLQQPQETVPIGPECRARPGVAARRGTAHQPGPLGIVGRNDAAAGDRHVLQIVSADQRHRADGLDTLRPALGIGKPHGGELHGCAGFDMKHQVADQFDGTADVLAGGHVDRAPSRGLGGPNGGAERLRGRRRAVGPRAVIQYVERRTGAPGIRTEQ